MYLFHQSWVVASAYFVFSLTGNPYAQMVLILLFSVAATFASYEIIRRIPFLRFLFAIKKYRKIG